MQHDVIEGERDLNFSPNSYVLSLKGKRQYRVWVCSAYDLSHKRWNNHLSQFSCCLFQSKKVWATQWDGRAVLEGHWIAFGNVLMGESQCDVLRVWTQSGRRHMKGKRNQFRKCQCEFTLAVSGREMRSTWDFTFSIGALILDSRR